MRILFLNLILIVVGITSVAAQEYEFRKWKYPMGPPLSGYNDSILGDYDNNKDIILDFDANEHTICKINIIDKYFKLYKLQPYYICEIETLEVLWNYKDFNQEKIKKIKYCVFPLKMCHKNEITGTFAIYNNYLSFQKKIDLKTNTRYYISQSMIITSANGDGAYSKAVTKLDNRLK